MRWRQAPESGEARFLLATALLETGDAVGAETEVRKAIELKYPADEAYPAAGAALLRRENIEKRSSRNSAAASCDGPRRTADLGASLGTAYLGAR